MGREIRRDRQAHATIDRRTMTTRTTFLRSPQAGVVLRVIELDVERFVEARRKTLERRIVGLRVRVTDETHRYRRARELAAMTVSAGFVAGEPRRRRVVGAFVTGATRDGAMLCAVVLKLRIVGIGVLGHRRSGKRQVEQSKEE